MNEYPTASRECAINLEGRSSVLASAVTARADLFFDHRQKSSSPAG